MADKEILRNILIIVLFFGGIIISKILSKFNAKQLEDESKVYKEIYDILQEKKNKMLSIDKYRKIKERLKEEPDEELFHTEAVIDSKLEGNKNDGILIPTLIIFIQIALKIGMKNLFADYVEIDAIIELTDYIIMLVVGFFVYIFSSGYFKLRDEKYILSLVKGELTERKDHNNNVAIHNSINKIFDKKKEVNDINSKGKSKIEIFFSIGLK